MSLDGFRPGGALQGDVYVPCSKSIAQRVIVCAALARGRTTLAPVVLGEDGERALAALACAGADVRRDGEEVQITGSPSPRGLRATDSIDVGESGTLARLLTAAFAFNGTLGSTVSISGSGSLARRRSPALIDALSAADVAFYYSEPPADGWPLILDPIEPPAEVALENPESSQEVSALLIALAAHPGPHELRVAGPIPSRPYVELTRSVLERFGARIKATCGDNAERFDVSGPLHALEERLIIEADASAAAVALAAGCLSGGDVRVPGIGAASPQGDVQIVEILSAFGCVARAELDALTASGPPRRGVDLDLAETPDLAPVAAALAGAAALAANESSLLSGLGTLPGKESSRIEVLAAGLRATGLTAETTSDSLYIAPGSGTTGPVELDPAGDHRMAFAFGLLSLVRAGVRVQNPDCVAKSWPAFWDELERSGARRG
jgi:3-phosphoshikimate 1-carboxyvinyltransferase